MSTVKKSVAKMPLAWARRNSPRSARLAVVLAAARASKDVGHAALRDRDAELLQLADDAQIAPARVLPCQADDQLDRLFGKGRPPWPPVWVGPVPSDERPVPAQDRLGRDEERRPPSPGTSLAKSGDQRPVGPGEPGSADLAAEHSQLVAEHRISASLASRPSGAPEELKEATDQAVEEAEGHGPAGSLPRSWLVKLRIRLLDPSGCVQLLDPAYDPVIELPPDDLLLGEVTEPHWMQTSNGLVQIESKDGLKKRLHRSTDRADAVVMAWWQDRERRQARMGDIRLVLLRRHQLRHAMGNQYGSN